MRVADIMVKRGLAVTVVGAAPTLIYAVSQHWSVQVPRGPLRRAGCCPVLGAIAGLYPAMRAAHLTPTEALRTALVAG
jgi:putative ABC transport system permease protein